MEKLNSDSHNLKKKHISFRLTTEPHTNRCTFPRLANVSIRITSDGYFVLLLMLYAQRVSSEAFCRIAARLSSQIVRSVEKVSVYCRSRFDFLLF